jgi:hypothetical protein
MTGDIASSNSLADLRERAKTEHAAVAKAMKTSLSHAFAAGDILIDAKLQLKHGQWLPWLQSCGIPERTAQRYIRLASNRMFIEAKSDNVSDLGVSGALALITLSRSSRDDLVGPTASLADDAAEMAFMWTHQDWRRNQLSNADYLKQLELMAEAKTTFDQVCDLISARPQLLEMADHLAEGLCEELVACCNAYKAARLAEMGLTQQAYDALSGHIDTLKERGLSRSDIVQFVWRKFGQEFMEAAPRPVPASAINAVALRARDIANEWLRRVEAAVQELAR